MNNSRYKSIQSREALEKFLAKNPKSFVVDTGDRERRFYVRAPGERFGLSVDGRSVRTLAANGKIKIRSAIETTS